MYTQWRYVQLLFLLICLPLILIGAHPQSEQEDRLRVALIDGCIETAQIPRSLNIVVSQRQRCIGSGHGITSLRVLAHHFSPHTNTPTDSSAVSLYFFGISTRQDLVIDQSEVERVLADINALAPDLLIMPIALEQRATTVDYLQELALGCSGQDTWSATKSGARSLSYGVKGKKPVGPERDRNGSAKYCHYHPYGRNPGSHAFYGSKGSASC